MKSWYLNAATVPFSVVIGVINWPSFAGVVNLFIGAVNLVYVGFRWFSLYERNTQ